MCPLAKWPWGFMTCSFCKSKIITITAHHLLILLERESISSVIIQLQLLPQTPFQTPGHRIGWKVCASILTHLTGTQSQEATCLVLIEKGWQPSHFRREGDCFSPPTLQGGTRWPCNEANKVPDIIHPDASLPNSNLLCPFIHALPGPGGIDNWLRQWKGEWPENGASLWGNSPHSGELHVKSQTKIVWLFTADSPPLMGGSLQGKMQISKQYFSPKDERHEIGRNQLSPDLQNDRPCWHPYTKRISMTRNPWRLLSLSSSDFCRVSAWSVSTSPTSALIQTQEAETPDLSSDRNLAPEAEVSSLIFWHLFHFFSVFFFLL